MTTIKTNEASIDLEAVGRFDSRSTHSRFIFRKHTKHLEVSDFGADLQPGRIGVRDLQERLRSGKQLNYHGSTILETQKR